MEKIKCDLCNSEDHKILFSQTDILHSSTDEEFNMVKCENCDLIFLNPRPTKQEIGKYYSDEYGDGIFHSHQNLFKKKSIQIFRLISDFAFSENSPLLLKFIARIILTPLFYLPVSKHKLVHNLHPKIKSYIDINAKGKFLDIGCGAGKHVHMYGYKESIISLSKKGWDVYGTEPSAGAKALLKKNGIKNVYDELLGANFKDDYFDVIRMNWSFEHVHYPTLYLEECKRILKKGGRLIISIPNYNGIIYKIFPNCVEIPIHLFYFSTDTFKKYCDKVGLKVVDYFTFSTLGKFLTGMSLMGRSDIDKYYIKNHSEAIKLQKFLNLMSDLDMGNDMVFNLTK